MDLTKAAQVGRYGRKAGKVVNIAESDLQSFTDDYLGYSRLYSFRIPDAFFRWVMAVAPAGVKIWFRSMFGGLPDNTVLIKISDRYCLCLNLELKTKSQLHGKQVKAATDRAWTVARTPEQVQAAVEALRVQSCKCIECLKKGGE